MPPVTGARVGKQLGFCARAILRARSNLSLKARPAVPSRLELEKEPRVRESSPDGAGAEPRAGGRGVRSPSLGGTIGFT